MANQFTSTKRDDRARTEARELAAWDVAHNSVTASDRELRRIAEGHCRRHGMRDGAAVIVGFYMEAYKKAVAEARRGAP